MVKRGCHKPLSHYNFPGSYNWPRCSSILFTMFIITVWRTFTSSINLVEVFSSFTRSFVFQP